MCMFVSDSTCLHNLLSPSSKALDPLNKNTGHNYTSMPVSFRVCASGGFCPNMDTLYGPVYIFQFPACLHQEGFAQPHPGSVCVYSYSQLALTNKYAELDLRS